MKPAVPNNWYVITGAPSAGKSTIIAELAKRGYNTVEEQGRLLIDQEMTKGKTLEEINVDSVEFEVAWSKMQDAREAQVDPKTLTFFDRGRLDTLAYFQYYRWPVPGEVKAFCNKATYKKIFVLELLDYDKDYARVETVETAQAMQELFGKVYADAGYEVIAVPRDTVENRLQLMLSHLA